MFLPYRLHLRIGIEKEFVVFVFFCDFIVDFWANVDDCLADLRLCISLLVVVVDGLDVVYLVALAL